MAVPRYQTFGGPNPATAQSIYGGPPVIADPVGNPQYMGTTLSPGGYNANLAANPSFSNQAILGQQPGVQYQTTDPNAPNYVDPNSYNAMMAPGNQAATANPSWWSSFNQGSNQFLGTPTGQLATYGAVGALGMYQAQQAQARAGQLAGSISTLGQPYSQVGRAQLGQISGGPQMGGPLGQGTALSTTAANELGNVAVQYGTGNLTPAQQLQVQSYVQQQKAMLNTQLAASGNLDSSYRQAQYQQIDNNAAMLTQQLTQGNIQIAQGALQSVQQTYSSILNQALASSQFGLGAQQAAVALQMASDAQIANSLNQLFGSLAQALGTAWGGGKGQQPGGGNAVQNVLKGLKGGGGNVNQPTAQSQWSPNDPNNPSSQNPYTALGTNYPGAPIGQPPPSANQLTDPTGGQSYWANQQTPNWNITGGDTTTPSGTVTVGDPGSTDVSAGDGGGG